MKALSVKGRPLAPLIFMTLIGSSAQATIPPDPPSYDSAVMVVTAPANSPGGYHFFEDTPSARSGE